MDELSDRVYAKTAQGRAALEARSLTGKPRTALILVNGRDNLHALRLKLGADAAQLIGELVRAGLVEALEPVPRPRPARPAGEPVTAAAPGAPVPAVPPEAQDVGERLIPLQREAVERLTPHFGPDVLLVSKPLLDATTLQAFGLALDAVERRLAIYTGKAQAARILAGLKP